MARDGQLSLGSGVVGSTGLAPVISLVVSSSGCQLAVFASRKLPWDHLDPQLPAFDTMPPLPG